MREIKFRAWCNGKIESSEMTETLISLRGLHQSDNFVLMQFTGLHDKNGKEIYEGDILKTYGGQTLTVEIEDLIHGDSKFHCLMVGGAKIIGNVNENPELLK